MAMVCEMTVEALVSQIARNLDSELERAVANELAEHMRPIINKAAESIVRDLKARIVATRRVDSDRLIVALNIDMGEVSVV